jgi:Zn ribbon nucleic-acid-binding protein
MGSVIDYIECPNCKQEAFSDFYYKTGEEYVNCTTCGYHYSSSYKRNDEGQFMTKDGTDDFSFSNLILEVNELKNPYGSFKIKYYDSKGFHCGSLVNEEDYIELKKATELDETVESILISRLINDEIKKELLIDNGPQFDSAGFTIEDR